MWSRNPIAKYIMDDDIIKKYDKYNELIKNEDTNNYFEISYSRKTLSKFQASGHVPQNYFVRNDTQYIFKKFIILVTLIEDLPTSREKVKLIIHNLSNEILFCIKNINVNDINNNGLSLQKLISFYDKKQQDETIKQKQDDIEKKNKLFIEELIKRRDKITINKE